MGSIKITPLRMRFLRLGFYFVTIQFLLSLHFVPAYAAAADTQPKQKIYAIVHWAVPANYLDYLANNFELIQEQPYNYELTTQQINELHSKNPNSKILRYRSSVEIFDVSSNYQDPASWSQSFAGRQNTQAEWDDIWAAHQDWFLKNENGQYIHRKTGAEMDGKRAYLVDPANPGWQSWLTQKLQQYIDYGYDGVWLDLAAPTYWSGWGSRAINPKTGKAYTNAEWREAIIGLVSKVKQGLGNKLVIINGLNIGKEYYNNMSPHPLEEASVDGFYFEGFVRWGNEPVGKFRSEADWKKDVDLVAKVSSSSKLLIVNTAIYGKPYNPNASKEDIERVMNYAIASYLLGKNGSSSYVRFSPPSYYDTGVPSYWGKDLKLYHLQIGDPVSSYYYKGNLYQRDFTTGKVLVNPSDTNKSYTINLGGNYQTPDGKTVNQITLLPKTGAILTKYHTNLLRVPKAANFFKP